MEEEWSIRRAVEEDGPRILDLYEQAKVFMAEHGNPTQWTKDYPGKIDVDMDIHNEILYVCTTGTGIEGTFVFSLGIEETYTQIEDGSWINEEPYGFLHRIVSTGKLKGMADYCLSWCFARCGNMRGDTHENNLIMQHVFKKNGFVKCGTVFMEDGTPRIAYQKTGTRIETERLALRNLTQADYENLCTILQDEETMYAYEHAFSADEVQNWLKKQIDNYERDGFGLFAVTEKVSGSFIGQCGVTRQMADGKEVLEVGYLFCRKYWHKGYAAEAAAACKKFAFEVLGAEEVYSIIRDNNYPSQNVAKRNGMKVQGSFVKHYRGIDMPHLLYRITREENKKW